MWSWESRKASLREVRAEEGAGHSEVGGTHSGQGQGYSRCVVQFWATWSLVPPAAPWKVDGGGPSGSRETIEEAACGRSSLDSGGDRKRGCPGIIQSDIRPREVESVPAFRPRPQWYV